MEKINYQQEMLESVDNLKRLIQAKNYRKVRDEAKHLLKLLDYDKASKCIYKLVLNNKNEKKN